MDHAYHVIHAPRSCKPRPVPPVDLALPYGPPAKQRVEEASCPACNPVLAAVAAKLPSCRRTKSRLVCGYVRVGAQACWWWCPVFTMVVWPGQQTITHGNGGRQRSVVTPQRLCVRPHSPAADGSGPPWRSAVPKNWAKIRFGASGAGVCWMMGVRTTAFWENVPCSISSSRSRSISTSYAWQSNAHLAHDRFYFHTHECACRHCLPKMGCCTFSGIGGAWW